MDLDSARLADPALDVGKLHADLRWQPIAGFSAASAQAEFLRGYAAEPATELLARARVWEAVWLVKIAARRVPIIDSLWQQRVEDLVERAGLLLESAQSQLDRH
jgi:aminoglycoside phosphotransferase (APT) family kinase protein